jgi:hypothetical protein
MRGSIACCWLPVAISDAFCTASWAFMVKLLKFIVLSYPQNNCHFVNSEQMAFNFNIDRHFVNRKRNNL